MTHRPISEKELTRSEVFAARPGTVVMSKASYGRLIAEIRRLRAVLSYIVEWPAPDVDAVRRLCKKELEAK